MFEFKFYFVFFRLFPGKQSMLMPGRWEKIKQIEISNNFISLAFLNIYIYTPYFPIYI